MFQVGSVGCVLSYLTTFSDFTAAACLPDWGLPVAQVFYSSRSCASVSSFNNNEATSSSLCGKIDTGNQICDAKEMTSSIQPTTYHLSVSPPRQSVWPLQFSYRRAFLGLPLTLPKRSESDHQ